MNVEQRLRAALESRASTAVPDPGALAGIRTRSARRAVRLRVAVATTAVAGVATAAFAVTNEVRTEPAPPVGTVSPAPTGEPSPPPTATAAAVGADEFVAVLDDGRLVVVSASTGRITRTVLTARPAWPAGAGVDVDLAPDRRTAYLTRPDVGRLEPCPAPHVERIDLTTGTKSPFARGEGVSVSPDGHRVAYLTRCGDAVVHVRDLVTGTVTDYDHSESQQGPSGEPMPWYLSEVLWHADGNRLWVLVDWENSPELRLLDPATDRTTADADKVEVQHISYDIERRRDGLVFRHQCCYPELTEDSLLVLRYPNGGERELVRAPASEQLRGPHVGPDGDVMYVRAGRLYRLDPDSGETTDLGRSTALARDW